MAIGRIPEPGTGIPESILDAKGDLISASAADTPARLAVGTNDQRLVAASGETTGLKWVADTQNTVVDAKGDLIVGTGADTVARLAVGTNGHTLVADSSTSTGLKWQAATSGGYTEIASGTLSGSSTQITTISGDYRDLVLVMTELQPNATQTILVQFNSETTNYMTRFASWDASAVNAASAQTTYAIAGTPSLNDNNQTLILRLFEYANTSAQKSYDGMFKHFRDNSVQQVNRCDGYHSTQSAITTIEMKVGGANTWSSGSYKLYGVK